MMSVRTTYELPYLVQFITVNKEKFGFLSIDIEILEDSFSSSDDLLVADLFARILRHILQKPMVRICSFQTYLVDLLKSTNASWNPPLKTAADYDALTAVDRLKLLTWLADQTKEKKDEIRDLLSEDFNSTTAENLENKEINVGTDSENRTYWYFHDLRLYRSKGSPHSKEGVVDWQCVAITLEEWQSLIAKLEKSIDEQEKELYTYLNDQLFLPTIKLLLEQQANGTAVLKVKKPTDEELKASEESDIAKMMQAANTLDQIKSNPELSKVLSEESPAKPPKDHDKLREDNSKKAAEDRKHDFAKSGSNQNGGMKAVASQPDSNVINPSSQHQNIKLPQQMPPQGSMHPLRTSGPYGPVNGAGSPHFPPQNPNIPPNHPSWNGQRPPMSGYGNMHQDSQGIWGPGLGMTSHGPDIAHDIVPDENLTPEQREHREAGMASLRKIHEMLLEDRQGGMQPMTDFSHINMAQDEFTMYCGPGQGRPPMMGPGGQPMGPGGQPMGPGGVMMGPGGHPMGPGGPPMGPGMMGPGHGHLHHLGSPMGPGPGSMHPGHPHMGPGGPLPPHMGGPPSHMDMAMYPGVPPMMQSKPPPPYPAPMAAPAPEAPPPRTSRPKKRKSTTTQPQSPLSQSLKSPKYQIPQSPLAGPTGMGPGFPMPDPAGMPPSGHPQMYKPTHGAVPINGLPPHHAPPQSNLMQAGPPEPFQGHAVANTVSSHKPPPSYSQSTNKRGSLESMHTPPPQKQYYSHFEGQELTIIKQANTAYQGADQPGGDSHIAQFPAIPSHAARQTMNPGSPMNSRASNITHITSASLANLAKGVEQMQQSMVEGGPFRDLQQQSGQPHPGMVPGGPNSGQIPMSSAAGTPLGGPNGTASSTGGPHQPSVNNTFVNAHMSIGSVNIQNVNAGQQHTGFDSQGRPVQMQQNIDVTMNTGNMAPGTPRFAAEEPSYPNNANQPPNPAVKVQAKGPNTLQYLPVSQQAALPPANDPIIPKQSSFDFGRGEQFATPLANLENKTPISKISYYPDNSRLPPPPPQRLPHAVSNNNPMASQAGSHAGVSQYSLPGHPHGMLMHSSPANHMSPGMMPNHPHHPQFSGGHPGPGGMIPTSSMYSPHGPYGPMPGTPGQELPPSSLGMMEPMHSPHMLSSQSMMMGHLHQSPLPAHPAMMPQSPFAPQGPPEFGPLMHGGHPGYPGGEFPPGMGGHPHGLSRQMSHSAALPGMPPQQMIMSPPHGSPYMNGPAPPGSGPYMMGGGM